jgi:hypothetical protein
MTIYENKSDKEIPIVIPIPIKSIDGVICNCYIMFNKYQQWRSVSFSAESDTVINDEEGDMLRIYNMTEGWAPDCDFDTVAKPKILQFCKNLIENLPKLKLTTFGRLSSNEDSEDNEGKLALCQIFGEFENVKLKHTIEDCCVCYNKTATKTKCKHPLCCRCWFLIPEENEDTGEVEGFCPLCREDITHI